MPINFFQQNCKNSSDKSIFKPNTIDDKESTCDGVLHHQNELVFVELKDRAHSGWLKKGREQLANTIGLFSANHVVAEYSKIEAYIVNKQRPLVNSSINTQLEQFKEDTGLTLKVKTTISI